MNRTRNYDDKINASLLVIMAHLHEVAVIAKLKSDQISALVDAGEAGHTVAELRRAQQELKVAVAVVRDDLCKVRKAAERAIVAAAHKQMETGDAS